MKEIEVKFKVEDIEAIEQALIEAGVELGEVIEQRDMSFAPEDWVRGEDAPLQVPFLRIRRQGNKSILTMKKPIENHLDRIEHETEISNPDEARKLIEQIGFVQDVEVNKARRKAKMGEYEICVDRIELLGDFIEIEKLVDDDADGVAIQKEIRKVLVDLVGSEEGIEEVDRGYDILMAEYLKKTT